MMPMSMPMQAQHMTARAMPISAHHPMPMAGRTAMADVPSDGIGGQPQVPQPPHPGCPKCLQHCLMTSQAVFSAVAPPGRPVFTTAFRPHASEFKALRGLSHKPPLSPPIAG